MYTYGYPPPTMPQINPYQQRIDSLMTQQLPRYEIIHLNGKGGADALQMAPNSSVLAMDDTAPMIWLITSDGAGYKTSTPFDITQHQSTPPVDVGGLESRVKRLEDILNGYQSNGGSTKRNKSNADNATDEQK